MVHIEGRAFVNIKKNQALLIIALLFLLASGGAFSTCPDKRTDAEPKIIIQEVLVPEIDLYNSNGNFEMAAAKSSLAIGSEVSCIAENGDLKVIININGERKSFFVVAGQVKTNEKVFMKGTGCAQIDFRGPQYGSSQGLGEEC